MDFALTEEQMMLRDGVRRFVQDAIVPIRPCGVDRLDDVVVAVPLPEAIELQDLPIPMPNDQRRSSASLDILPVGLEDDVRRRSDEDRIAMVVRVRGLLARSEPAMPGDREPGKNEFFDHAIHGFTIPA